MGLRYGIYRFVLPPASPTMPLVAVICGLLETRRFDPNDRSLLLDFHLDGMHQAELIELGIRRMSANIRRHLGIRPECCVRFSDRTTKRVLVEDKNGVVSASY